MFNVYNCRFKQNINFAFTDHFEKRFTALVNECWWPTNPGTLDPYELLSCFIGPFRDPGEQSINKMLVTITGVLIKRTPLALPPDF
jgi:hypothetical protein